MRIKLACNLEWSGQHANAEKIALAFGNTGFEFKGRAVPNGSIISIARPVEIELNTMNELVELQKSLGYPIMIEDGHLEVVS